MRVGFTGTRTGLSDMQRQELDTRLASFSNQQPGSEFHHGCCVGADFTAHLLAKSNGLRSIGHPPLNTKLMAVCDCDEMRDPDDYLARDRAIVHECDVLLACPKEYRNVPRGSGTWYTIRYAATGRKPHIIIFPDGSIEAHWEGKNI